MSHLWGIDLGGTKIEGVVMPATPLLVSSGASKEKGLEEEIPAPLARIRIETQANLGYRHTLSRIAHLVDLLETEVGERPERIGIGTPGSKNPHSGLMRNCNTTCLNGMPMLEDLQKELGLEIRIANDANCFALAETLWGAGKGYETVFGVIMGTGVGGGLVVNGQALEGVNGIGGEWGHIVLDPEGPECYCGRRGCVETFLSGPANEREYFLRSGQKRTFKEIADSASSDQDAQIQIDRLCGRFGRAISYVVNVFDPHAIVLGGGVGQVEALLENAESQTRPWVFSDSFNTPFLLPKLGDSAGVFGAALLAI